MTRALSTDELRELEADLEWLEIYRRTHQREYALDGGPMRLEGWYDWQQRYFRSSVEHTETLLLAGNQVGKSQTAAYEDALDLTGDYPDWWPGYRFSMPINLWLLGVDAIQLRNVLQLQLFGELRDDGSFTGGWVHPDEVLRVVRSKVATGLAAEIFVKHRLGVSKVSFKAHSQVDTGRGSLPMAGSVVDKVRCDEQPPDEILGQLAVRTLNGNQGRGGKRKFTLTPEDGETELIRKFMNNPEPSQELIGPITWDDAPHLTPERQVQALAGIPEHEHEMRRLGIPFMGSGRVFRYDEKTLLVDPFQAPPWFVYLRAIDLGIDHPTAVAWLSWDPETEIYYVARTYRQGGKEAAVHAYAANSLWRDIPIVFPPDMDEREKGSGRTVRQWYENAGLANGIDFNNCDENETRYVEPGILAMQDAMDAGRFKILRGANEPLIEELRSYHRKDGKIVKKRDDTIDAVRYAFMMMRRYGEPLARTPTPTTAQGTVASRRRR